MADTSLDKDAIPELPRPQTEQNESQSEEQHLNAGETEALEQSIQRDTEPPTEDWQFKHMLLTLAEEITDSELEKIKFLFSGEGGLGDKALEKIKTPLDLFLLMQKRCWLSRDNLLRLQGPLNYIGRKDLIRIAAEYAQRIGNILHFYRAPEPENGCTSVKLHIDGHSYHDATRDTIQVIRSKFARLLFCPQELIVIAGVEPATSLILTLHIPDLYMDIFKDLLETNTCKARLRNICIDMVEIEGVDGLIFCSDDDVTTKQATEQQKRLHNVYQLLEIKTEQLDSTEAQLVELNSKIQALENERFEREAVLKSLKSQLVQSDSDVPSEKTDMLKNFEILLKRPELAVYDKSLILSLLDANTQMVAKTVAGNNTSLVKKLQSDIEELQDLVLPLRFELLKFRTFTNQEEIENILQIFRQLFASIKITQTIEIDEDIINILKKIGGALRYREREKLLKKYEWEPNEDIKQAVDNDSSLCLVAIFHKEIITSKNVPPLVPFITRCLKEVNRKDLEKKFQNLLCSLDASRKARHTASKRKEERSRSLDREGNATPELNESKLKQIADQVQEMHDIIIPAHESMKKSAYFDMSSPKLFTRKGIFDTAEF